MQFAKDSFYMALRERLASLNPQRTVTLNGATRPAVVGRTLTALDMELMSICQPLRTAKCDFTQTPSVDLGTNVFWTAPQFDSITGSNGPRREALPGKTQSVRLERRALLKVFFFSEVNAL